MLKIEHQQKTYQFRRSYQQNSKIIYLSLDTCKVLKNLLTKHLYFMQLYRMFHVKFVLFNNNKI